MSFRNKVRSTAIRAAVSAQLDEIALHLNARYRKSQFGIVISLHETPRAYESQFRQQLEWVSKHFSIVDLDRFARLWDPEWQSSRIEKPLALFTFDDGRESNYSVAAPLLEEFGARGVFFVVPGFAECSEQQAPIFYRTKINPGSLGNETAEYWKPMTPAQIADLAARGHMIGNHTRSHANLKGLSPDQLEDEIGDSARKIGNWTQKPVHAFAWTFAWDAIDRSAWEFVQRYHRFCFAPCAGVVDSRRDSPSMIWRREIEVRYSTPELRFLYSGLADPAWARRRSMLRKMGCSTASSA
jgi:peptidoglycan/xylan/chitin deacetylase (PgdA/CDA1 family)